MMMTACFFRIDCDHLLELHDAKAATSAVAAVAAVAAAIAATAEVA
jgi:hypothetical protein